MGVPLNVAVVLREWLRRSNGGERLLSFGAQSLDFTPSSFAAATGEISFSGSALSYFRSCGYRETRALDVSDFEGAEIIFDLNEEETPAHLIGQFDAVFNGGTLEHVFHVPNALSHLTRMLRDGGIAIHLSPCHNWVDHGFYQFGPTLFFDYYDAAGFAPLESALFFFDAKSPGPWEVEPAPPEAFGAGLSGTFDHRTALHLFMARKTAGARDRVIPCQSLYRTDRRLPRPQPRWFPPCSMLDGAVLTNVRYIERPLGPFVHDSGFCWTCLVAEWNHFSDTSAEPIRSPVVISENGVLLGPSHSRHDQIRADGAGRYSHWGNAIYCSTSDGSDPNQNGRAYLALAPIDRAGDGDVVPKATGSS